MELTMIMILKALGWAGLIIAGASFANANGVSESAAFGIIAGVTGAAVGSLYGHRQCGAEC
jgi:uncharacterized protein YfiM (DUF2279 family)